MSRLLIHHLRLSQSERIPWLCEELGIPYELRTYSKSGDSLTSEMVAPDEYKKLHWIGTAPVIQDKAPSGGGKKVVLAETNAIVAYILGKYGDGRLEVQADDENYPEYLFWIHFSQGTFHPNAIWSLPIRNSVGEKTMPEAIYARRRLTTFLEKMNERLGKCKYLVGDELTVADILMFFHVSTGRLQYPYELKEYPHIVKYVKRVSSRPAYKVAMEKANGGLVEDALGAGLPSDPMASCEDVYVEEKMGIV
ncbi:hypothetical protein KEM55_001031 [Ascosphaera atra]|nr:hypothetical protein KEM55_001031 [Ascosphaera atra]